ncbi:MAG TPA: hypothetical protein VMB26_17795, partial [Candidatus Binataceae bacterium]|nr:hypothetical protein [Candidatus Binataceae bacterium]
AFDDTDPYPRIGYVLSGWQRLSRGRHRFDFTLVRVSGEYPLGTLQQELHVMPNVKVYRADSGS